MLAVFKICNCQEGYFADVIRGHIFLKDPLCSVCGWLPLAFLYINCVRYKKKESINKIKFETIKGTLMQI